MDASPTTWRPTACILCSRNCGIGVDTDDTQILRVRGDEKHPISAGYLCQKAARLDRYQNHADRLTHPLRRRPDGTFEEVSWDVAIQEIAQRLVRVRDQHGGRALALYGGGGQGNHLGGIYARGLVAAMGTRYHYSALAQEKTGDFWVNGRLFGRQSCHVTEGLEQAELAIFIGTNPWQAHGIRNARDTLKDLSRSRDRKMVVIDPRRTETAELADLHLQLRPGTDAYLLAAMLALIVQDGYEDRAFLAEWTTGFEAVRDVLRKMPIDALIARADVPVKDVEQTVRWLLEARSAAVRVDLGLQQSLHSTLNSYLEKLLFLLPGHFGRPGCNALHSAFVPLIGHSDDPGPGSESWTTALTGLAEIGKLFPPNVLPAEIDNEDPRRIRALVVDSANPVMSGADTRAWRRALERLQLLVAIDVTRTETTELAHYVLPAASQYEKWETTFFNLEFPTQALQLRRPLFAPMGEALPEPEIYWRLLVAMGILPREGFPLLRGIAVVDRRWPALGIFPAALKTLLERRPELSPYAAFVLYDTLGNALPDGAQAAAPLWASAHTYARKHPAAVRRTGLKAGRGRVALGEALFASILGRPSGAPLSHHEYREMWSLLRHEDKRIHLEIPELLEELAALPTQELPTDDAHPLVLIAGERRSYNANQIFRDPGWRKDDRDGALRLHPDDAARLGLEDGHRAVCESGRGEIEVTLRVDPSIRPGVVTLPHGYGASYPDSDGTRRAWGPILNLLTDAGHRDPRTATPYHKYVPVKLRPLAPQAAPQPEPQSEPQPEPAAAAEPAQEPAPEVEPEGDSDPKPEFGPAT